MFQLAAITDELSPNLEHALDMACDFGIRQVELHTAWGQSVELWSNDQIAVMEKELNKRRLGVCCISSTVFLRCHLDDNIDAIPRLPGFRSIAGSYQDHLTALVRCLVIARKLRAPIVRIFGFWRDGPTTEDTYIQAAERLSSAVEIAASNGIKLALENCPHTHFDWGMRTARLVEEIDSGWLGMLWDPCSGLRAGEPDYLSAYDEINKSLLHIHAKDMVLENWLKRGRKYVPVTQGLIDWEGIFNRLVSSEYEGLVCLETHHNGPDGTRESAARESFSGLQRVYQDMVLSKDAFV